MGKRLGASHRDGLGHTDDVNLHREREFWDAARDADAAFQAALAEAGAAPGVHTEPQTATPRRIAGEVIVRSANRWVMPADDPLVR